MFYYNNLIRMNLRAMSVFILGIVYFSERNISILGWRVVLVASCLLFFSVNSLFLMFFFFEFILFPVLMVIFFYGSQPEKVGAIYYILAYTVSLSIGFLYVIITVGEFNGHMNFILTFYILGLFSVKCPLFGIHLWLPKAHVEAPTRIRMLLAGLLLKVGLYGLCTMTVFLNVNCTWLL